ncbi:HNH endonuclease signature motif containing protein [Pseudarthrobacter sp. GA104]|uniref:HNH endonuclease signature motif containing protein n=1 Tax=Pseudarthrobacter sp. GA104 TaxID=2676311 RepID=UPI0012F897FC|nr:HNH endonuclease signature motif containing protein [Pseudarthrobacter sp. GA104]MUU72105.1 DUF222 domain-containing protein [Pseudarthrobacter sp. GA104]
MGNGAGTNAGAAVVMEGIHASVGALDALFLEEARLDAGPAAPAGPDPVVDVLQRKIDNRLERLAVVARLEAQLAAAKARDGAEILELQHAMIPPNASLQDRSYQEMSIIEEIAGVLTVSSPAAGALISQARQLRSLPLALDALSAGTISWQHAKILADETHSLGPAGAAAMAVHFLDADAPHPARGAAPGDLVPSRFRAKVRAWRERHHPESLEKRHAKAATDRRMEYSPDRDGMAWLSLYLPGDTASAIWNRTTALARGLQGPNESRTLTQLRPDTAAALLLSTPDTRSTNTSTRDTADEDAAPANAAPAEGDAARLGKVPAPKADVLVTVPVFALLGLTDEPAMLDGYGPIPASTARKLVADGATSFHRVLVDPRDGAPLEIGRTSYRLTKAMKQALRLRDGKCTFPGCNNRTSDNEADHLTAWHHGGTTGISNLAQLCPKHHRLKHNSRWKPTPGTKTQPPGWTSPTGRHYKPEHHDWEPPQWPGNPAQLQAVRGGPPCCPPEIAYIGQSPAEDAIDKFLHARP